MSVDVSALLRCAFSTAVLWTAATAAVAQPAAPVTVRVGVYPFAPYAEERSDGHYEGLTPELLQALNALQPDYHFVTVPVSPKRRYQAFRRADYDMIFFESPAWGWADIPAQRSVPVHHDAEVYVALRADGRDQHYFDDLHGKRLLGVSGFHYALTGFNADEQVLQQQFNVLLSWNQATALHLLQQRRGDVALINRSFLQHHLNQHPALAEHLLVSERADHHYSQHILIQPNFIPGADEINRLLQQLAEQGTLEQLFASYQSQPCPLLSTLCAAR